MTTIRRRAQRAPFAPIVAAMFAAAAAVLAAMLPDDLLGLIAPPTALVRLGIVLAAFIVAFTVVWAIAKPIGAMLDRGVRERQPWRDTGYDAPVRATAARRPIFAPEELGAPLMSDEALTTVTPPDPDLEAPVASMRLAAPVTARSDSSIDALIVRLEAGLARRAANDPGPGAPAAAPLPLSTDWIVAQPPEETGPRDDDDGHGALRQALGQLRRLAS